MVKSVVSIVKNSDPYEAVAASLQLLGGTESLLRNCRKVLIKPNLSFPIPPQDGPDTTDPQVVGAAVRAFKECGAKKVIVGDQSVWGVRTRDTCKIIGLKEIVEKEGGELCYFDEEPRVLVDVPNGKFFDTFDLPKIIKEVDMIVNLPKMKTSFISHVTLGIKNHVGYLTFQDRQKFHRMYDLAYVVVDIARVVRPNLTLIDGIVAMEGYGPHSGTAKRMNLVIGSSDLVAVDAVGAEVMGFDALEIPTTQIAMKQGLGKGNLSEIEVVGEPIDKVKQTFERSYIRCVSPYPNVDVYIGGMCPGCAPRIPTVPPNPDPNKKYAVVVGRRAKLPKNLNVDEIWCIGNCGIDSTMSSTNLFPRISKEQIKFIPGCPPLKWYGSQTILKLLKEKGWAKNFSAR